MASTRDKGPDKAATELLRRSLARDSVLSAANDPCPEPEILAAYFERSLNAEETARCELHLSACARCREELALLERAGERPAIEGRLARRRAWLWNWRWLAPVAATLVVAAVWIAQRPLNPNRELQSQQPLVPMSQPSEPPTREAPKLSRAPSRGAPRAAAPSSEMAQNRALDKAQNSLSREIAPFSANENRSAVAPLDNRRDAGSNLSAKSAGARQSDSEERAARTETESKAMADGLQTAPASPAVAPPPAQTANAAGGIAGGEADSSAQALKSKKQMAVAAKPNLYAQKDEKAALALSGIGAGARVVRTPDPKVLWQIAEKGILKSQDGGATWHQADLPVANAPVVALAAPSAQVCWLVGRDSLILLTTDGTHWQSIVPPAQADFVKVVAENESSATVTSVEGARFQTRDSGKHWRPIP